MSRKFCRNFLLFAAVVGLIFGSGCGGKQPETETWRHAFLLGDGLVFAADIPKDWRYILYPVDDYGYYDRNTDHKNEERSIAFVGMGEKDKDGEDNFFTIWVHRGKWEVGEYSRVLEPFVFRDDTQGEWGFRILESAPHYGPGAVVPFYEGEVYDPEKDCGIHLLMLGGEYDANEQIIKNFLGSACFRDDDFGAEGETDVLEQGTVTLHIWNRAMRMSLQVPEGVRVRAYEGDHCAISLDEEHSFSILPDYDGDMLERSGDYHYYLNVQDFEETVYEIPTRYNEHNYYFPNQYLFVLNWDKERGGEELQGCLKKIVQSMRFE